MRSKAQPPVRAYAPNSRASRATASGTSAVSGASATSAAGSAASPAGADGTADGVASSDGVLGVRFLASEYQTGPWHRGRIDNLGLDENGSPVVIEFKKGSDSGVMSQAVSYLSWLESAHHEFEALVRKVLGAEAAESVDWRRPRIICIAAGFSHHDRVAVQRLPERIDLVRYRIFDGGLLGLLLVDSATGFPSAASSRRGRERAPVADSVPTASAISPPAGGGAVPECLRHLYAELDEASRRGARWRWRRCGTTSPTGGW
ncbi:hypothetical protein QIT00_08110 [Streptomyces sp. B-S-A12]|uniref:DUF91 domain-containing protein n=1 Tax=Streptomyces luteolus TaxID=3043615 RepID=A0ABT6SSG8_9ACTN|nr:hypothetical protein [Streptomyces sp. B-S-A12]MDI3418526.1 hypothetical protein [Streptomyces sp. B-S-A12]